MALIEQIPFADQIVDAPPIRLDLGSVVVPAEVELTFVAGMHDAHLNNTDYLGDMFASSDVVVTELFGYSKRDLKEISAIAKGSYRDLQRNLESQQIRQQTPDTETDYPGMRAGQAAWDISFNMMLFSAKRRGTTPLRVLCCDYPANHPDVRFGAYVRAIRRFSTLLLEGSLPRIEDLETMARRDIYIGTQLCKSIEDLRRTDSKLGDKSPLNIFMPYGGDALRHS